MKQPRICSVVGCGRPYQAQGLCMRHYARAWRESNPTRRIPVAAPDRKHREYLAIKTSPAYRARKKREKKRWEQAHPESKRNQKRAGNHARRARRWGNGGIFSAKDWRDLISRSVRCHWCKRPWGKTRRPTHDHVTPLSEGGLNSVENSVCACAECNSRKGDRKFNPVTGQGILV